MVLSFARLWKLQATALFASALYQPTPACLCLHSKLHATALFASAPALSVFAFSLSSSLGAKGKKGDALAADDGDEGEDYAERMSRWLRESLQALRDIDFWRSLMVGSISRGPLFHAQRWLQGGDAGEQTPTDQTSKMLGSKMPDFVNKRAEAFGREFEDLLRDSKFEVTWMALLKITDGDDDQIKWFGHAAFSVLQLLANYHRRILRTVRSYPCKILCLLCDPPDCRSEK